MKRIIILLVPIILLTSCAGTKRLRQLNHHQQLLARVAANKSMSAEQKMDTLALSLIEMMNEGLNILNPKKGAQYVETYLVQNDAAINSIFGQIDDWQSDMKPAEKLLHGIALTRKPYAKEFVDLIKRFERKYKQVRFVAKLLGKTKDLFAWEKLLGL